MLLAVLHCFEAMCVINPLCPILEGLGTLFRFWKISMSYTHGNFSHLSLFPLGPQLGHNGFVESVLKSLSDQCAERSQMLYIPENVLPLYGTHVYFTHILPIL